MKKTRTAAHPASNDSWQGQVWEFRLYVAGQTPRSVAALDNLESLCRRYLGEHYNIDVIDLMERPERARTDQIVAIPTLVRTLPEPVRRVIGDLSNTERVLASLQLNRSTEG